ncbi:MAG TPA: OmpW family outer membrane protein [Burkholderiaceae bacterium]|nr:OmpW family outer membrane protein [Burkholderiaceae bacterium]
MTQRTISKTLRLLPAAVLLACAGAHADDAAAPNELRLGAYFVHYKTTAHDLSGPYTPAGINIRVGNVTTTYITYVRHLDDNWALELAGGIPPTAKTYGKGPATVGSVPFNNQEVATAKWFSPSLLLDYRFLTPASPVRPFVGLGVNYTRFYKLDSTPAGDAANGGPTRVRLSTSFGPAATVGGSWQVTREINVIAAFSAARVNSNYRSDTAGVIRTTSIHFNPRAFILAAGYSF